MNSKHLIAALLTGLITLWAGLAHAQEAQPQVDAVTQAYLAALEAAGTNAEDVTDEQLGVILNDLYQQFVSIPGGIDITALASVAKASPQKAAFIGNTLAQLEPRRAPALAAALVSVVPPEQARRVVNAIVQGAPRYARQISERVSFQVPADSITTPNSQQDGPQVSPSAID